MTLGEYIRRCRVLRHWTLAQLSQKADISLSYLADIEHGRTEPSLAVLRKIAQALGVSAGALLVEAETAE